MMLATKLGKETTIHNAASEPHIQDLANALNAMGARIEGIGSNVLHICGTGDLRGTDVTISPNHRGGQHRGYHGHERSRSN
jgi:UDP-N-acetylglucosamine 1-carboxyvinyltransferase